MDTNAPSAEYTMPLLAPSPPFCISSLRHKIRSVRSPACAVYLVAQPHSTYSLVVLGYASLIHGSMNNNGLYLRQAAGECGCGRAAADSCGTLSVANLQAHAWPQCTYGNLAHTHSANRGEAQAVSLEQFAPTAHSPPPSPPLTQLYRPSTATLARCCQRLILSTVSTYHIAPSTTCSTVATRREGK